MTRGVVRSGVPVVLAQVNRLSLRLRPVLPVPSVQAVLNQLFQSFLLVVLELHFLYFPRLIAHLPNLELEERLGVVLAATVEFVFLLEQLLLDVQRNLVVSHDLL